MILVKHITIGGWSKPPPHVASIRVVYMKVKRTGAKPSLARVDWTLVPPSRATDWAAEALSETFQLCLILSDSIWFYLTLSDTFGYCLRLFESVRLSKTLSDTFWCCLILSETFWDCLILSDTVWDFVRLSETGRDCPRLGEGSLSIQFPRRWGDGHFRTRTIQFSQNCSHLKNANLTLSLTALKREKKVWWWKRHQSPDG